MFFTENKNKIGGDRMKEKNRIFNTGQGVPESGEYLCQSGERAKFNKNEEFPACPISGKETTWHWQDRS